ncbi:MAG: phosphatidate cytidylyltransferase [Treponema sp.]|jgi:phosphatidate cytidylyltransferase|nr:phosphatidate cytidylyltransferase [Treponema sp.]
MKKLVQRLLLFIITLPLIAVIVIFLPYRSYLAVNIIVVILSALGAGEFAAMLNKKGRVITGGEACVLGAAGPAVATLTVSFGLNFYVSSGILMAAFAWVLLSRVFTAPDKFKSSLDYITSGFAVLIYPGFFMMWIILMIRFLHTNLVILGFFFMVVASDSVGWTAGMLFGANNRGIIPASPNKSVAGFIGGFTGSVLIGMGAARFFPAAFTSKVMPSLWAGAALGFVSAAAASLGDLAESVMKRSSGIKDSGGLIPGRGGVLDSIDSIAMAAPVYYGLYRFLFM